MKYMGSKKRAKNLLLPLFNKFRDPSQVFVDVFTGGGNVLDMVGGPRIGFDLNRYTIAALQVIRDDLYALPKDSTEFTEEMYCYVRDHKDQFDDGLVGYVGFALSYGAKFFGGWCRDSRGLRDYVSEAYRSAVKQHKCIQNVELIASDYRDIKLPKDSFVYCDPPYRSTTGYRGVDAFNSDEFWEWVRRHSLEGHTILVSELEAPQDFIEVGCKSLSASLTRDTGSKKMLDKVFMYETV